MKYQYLASLALALSASSSVSAVPLKPEANGSCPAGYSPSVYYITVTASAEAEPTATSVVEPTSTSTLTSTSTSTLEASSSSLSTSTSTLDKVKAPSTVGAIETIPAAVVEVSTSSTESASAAPASTLSSSLPAGEIETLPTTQVAVAQPSTATTSTTEEAEATTSTSTTNASASKTSSSSSSSSTTGSATFYGGNLSGGTCSFTDYTLPSHLTGVAYSGEAWDDAAECGACVEVTGPDGNSVKAMIVDKCPECSSTHLDLFESAFTTLASKSEGEIPITYSSVSCSITSPLKLRNKSGTSAYWFSMQVVNANEAVSSLEVSTDGGSTWQSTQRSDYNFFENDAGFGSETVDVRVTGKSGGTVVVKGVSAESGSSVEADGNL
ncbi:putative extracellular cellulase CelA/allergen Asp F7-like [Aspergillus undulatus]|uniref:putative extracellular cellulase CelA/allergen Asp F7-like n=1 Tax=Aspergillus undulatus TaxID=1810928 RepID=UPI003CCD8920